MSIQSREDANKYYDLINNLIDDYIQKWKIRPSNLRRYLKPGTSKFHNFLERNGLKDIKGSDIILRDVIEDRYSMETDGVIKFESFKLLESLEIESSSLKECLYKEIGKSSLYHEKAIADYFDTNLSQIEVIDADKHLFKLENWESKDIEVIIYDDIEISTIVGNVIDRLLHQLKKQEIDLTNNISINLYKMINDRVFTDQMNDMFGEEDFTYKVISDILGFDYKGVIVGKNNTSMGKGVDYVIWIKK
jgi:hypothetical protein